MTATQTCQPETRVRYWTNLPENCVWKYDGQKVYKCAVPGDTLWHIAHTQVPWDHDDFREITESEAYRILGLSGGMRHREVPIQVNAWVDEGVAPLVQALNEHPAILTVDSCEGYEGPAYVHFNCRGDWAGLTTLVHSLSTQLGEQYPADDEYCLQIEWVAGSAEPIATLYVRRSAVQAVTQAISEAVPNLPNSQSDEQAAGESAKTLAETLASHGYINDDDMARVQRLIEQSAVVRQSAKPQPPVGPFYDASRTKEYLLTGEHRPPKAGEYYLLEGIGVAKTPTDKREADKRWILKPRHQCQCRSEAEFLPRLREANIKRARRWNPDANTGLEFDMNELAGEVGEACNVAKKIARHRHGMRGGKDDYWAKSHLSDELADVVITADLAAARENIDLEGAIRRKFNATSHKHGLGIYLHESEGSGRGDD